MPRRITSEMSSILVLALIAAITLIIMYFVLDHEKGIASASQDQTNLYFSPKNIARPELERKEEATKPDRSIERKKPPVKEKINKPKPTNEVPPLLQVIIDHESGGDYRAYNPTGCSDQNGTFSCGGKYQLSEQYASVWAANAGFPGQPSNAASWSPAIQDAVALDLFEKTNGSLWCNYTDYC